jgi:Flp pilus assembly protein TadG
MMKQSAGPTCFRLVRELRLRAHGEQGSAMVEMAMSMILLLTILFGILELCLALYSYHFVSEAAREGTRYAIVRGSTSASDCPSNPVAACPAAASDIKSHVSQLGFPGINITASDVTVAWSVYPAGGTCTPSATCNNPGNMVKVTVAYPFQLSIPFVQRRMLTMTSASEMVISQ